MSFSCQNENNTDPQDSTDSETTTTKETVTSLTKSPGMLDASGNPIPNETPTQKTEDETPSTEPQPADQEQIHEEIVLEDMIIHIPDHLKNRAKILPPITEDDLRTALSDPHVEIDAEELEEP